ncbi:heat-inducible transcriptional repressor HrcA [Microvirga tunisiensis]|uniref:Heat-inducible transcriptional repressor HrcA n=2 Tax=Pannonibacter tanglangensis TaxID=2750084 RepID=A0ABW9ZRH9_9HYPH|nr:MULTISPECIES: heat-inducible transcriptional repressor HrcA [unclassified Pannonibacter]NBN65657.1 heat-inducible transcriptional repressor HrcA [Pannonibacter sp. XCT-34]NBN80116.1 heat-inducible transcriptional repressor HrcA [Pannonibacter sp. XCT-53]
MVSLSELDKRSREIFRSIVESYLDTGEPVGSRNVARGLGMSLSPASVRNVMADLEHLGLLYSPHTSAGRLPTETGLRFFIDALLEVGDLSREERERIDVQVRASGGRNSEQVLTEATQLLSGLTSGAAVVLTHKQDIRLKHVEFIRIEPLRALAVLVGEDGSVENRIVDLPPNLPSSALVQASNYLNAQIQGRTLADVRRELERLREADQAELDLLTQKIVETGLAVWGGDSGDGDTLIVRGQSNLLTDVGAAEDLERVRLLFDDLENKRDLIQLLGLAEKGDGVRIFIGSENKLFSLSGSSLVVSPYRDREQRIIGVLGVIGPTRLNYARVIPMVDYTARLVSRLVG